MTGLKLQVLSYRKHKDGGRGPNVIDIRPALEAVAEFAHWHKETIEGLPKELMNSEVTKGLIEKRRLQRIKVEPKPKEAVEDTGPIATVLKLHSNS